MSIIASILFGETFLTEKLTHINRDEINGDLAPANGDAYFLYGQALLQFAIQQNTVLGQSAQASATKVEEQQEIAKEEEGKISQYTN